MKEVAVKLLAYIPIPEEEASQLKEGPLNPSELYEKVPSLNEKLGGFDIQVLDAEIREV